MNTDPVVVVINAFFSYLGDSLSCLGSTSDADIETRPIFGKIKQQEHSYLPQEFDGQQQSKSQHNHLYLTVRCVWRSCYRYEATVVSSADDALASAVRLIGTRLPVSPLLRSEEKSTIWIRWVSERQVLANARLLRSLLCDRR